MKHQVNTTATNLVHKFQALTETEDFIFIKRSVSALTVSELHNELWDIEFHEGGSIQLSDDTATFWGDNGTFDMSKEDFEKMIVFLVVELAL